jgi:YesN/AraC family two-component response regulator
MKTILVIEAKTKTRKLVLKNLKLQGFYTFSAVNGASGVQLARENLPDLIVCGMRLPELNGYEVLAILRQEPATAITPFIFIATQATEIDFRKSMQLGANDYLTEPFTSEELMRAIETQLEKQALLRQFYSARYNQVSETRLADTAIVLTDSEETQTLDFQAHQVLSFIKANYHRAISLSDVAQAVGYSPAYLTDLMRRQTGQTVQRWIIEHRMAAARSLLLETDRMMEQIAIEVGYNNVVHFFRQFRQIHGTTPQAWRNANRNQQHKIERSVSLIQK